MLQKFKVTLGSPHPLGATPTKNGVNFSIFSEHGTAVELLLFAKNTDKSPFQTITLDSNKNKTYHFWHVLVEGLKPGCFYAFRVDGPFELSQGHRFNRKKILIDPYSKGIDHALFKREESCHSEDNIKYSMRSVVMDVDNYNWEGDKPLNRPIEDSIVYEMHVGSFTNSPSSGVKYTGKFKGVVEKIPYLKSLGITAVELMPVFDFGSGDSKNFWGYGTVGFFAPESRYCTSPGEASHIRDFREMVKAFHKAGIEVILDIVFGYTTEGDHKGPTLCFKGFDNTIYYQLSKENKEYYMNFSGCGNTLNANHPVVSKFIVDCLEYWVEKMHVDGFRFDEASIMSRDEDGNIMHYPHVLWNIDLSEKLSQTKIFAEPWDAGGAYLVGRFPGYRFVEWNGRFRDDIRRFVRGDPGLVSSVAGRITGSADLYQHSGRLPINSLNFITSHDGFTLYDLVAYDHKHNEANGEDNKDGVDENYSWNCGVEGETDNPNVLRLRLKQIRNLTTMLFLSKGIPMIVMGDEIGRTQKGNNNAYCQNNEISWFDWNLVSKNSGLLEFYKKLIAFRKRNRFFSNNDTFVEFLPTGPEIQFHSTKINSPQWDNKNARVLAYTLRDQFHVMINMDDEGMVFEVPHLTNKKWHLAIDTADEGIGIADSGQEKPIPNDQNFYVESKSIVVLLSK